MTKTFKLVFMKSHRNYRLLEGAAFDLTTAGELVSSGVCRIDPTEPEPEALEEAVRAHKRATPSGQRWEIALVQPRYFR